MNDKKYEEFIEQQARLELSIEEVTTTIRHDIDEMKKKIKEVKE